MADARDDDVVGPGVGVARALAREDRDRRPAGRLRAAMGRGHDLVEPAGHDRAAALGQEPPDLLGLRDPVGPAADDCDLRRCHRAIVGGDAGTARGSRRNARSSAAGSPARTSRACSASAARRSSTPTTSCSTRRCSRRPPPATLEPRHVVVPLRQMCPHAELLLGHVDEPRPASGARSSRRRSAARSRSPTSGSSSRSARCRGRSRCPASRSTGAASRTSPTRSRLRNHLLRSLESAAARLDPRGGRARPRLRLRRSGLRRGRGARRAQRPRPCGRPPLVPDAAGRPPAVGARRRRPGDPRRDPTQARASTRIATSRRSAGSRSTSGRRSTSFDGREAVLADGARIPARTLVWAAGVRPHPAPRHARPSPRRARPRHGRRDAPRDRHATTSGRSATARPCRTPARPAASTRRRASTRCARRGGWRRTSAARRGPYGYRMLGQVATLGRYKGIAELPGPASPRLPRLVRRADVPPLRAPDLPPQDARRDGLDGVALLPARHRRALGAGSPAQARAVTDVRRPATASGSARPGSSCGSATGPSSRRSPASPRRGSILRTRCRSPSRGPTRPATPAFVESFVASTSGALADWAPGAGR